MRNRDVFLTRCGAAALLLALLAPVCAFADLDDKVLTFSTPGIDRYADGSRVLDGECYALVWSPVGKAFSGFNADGTAASPEDCVVLAAPLAQNGRCPESIFQIPAEEYAVLQNGTWTVCLVDTRRANGVPAGAENGLPKRVNRWVAVKAGVEVRPSSASGVMAAAQRATSARAAGQGVLATTLSEVPESAAKPTITAMEVSDDTVTLLVADTVPYLTYTIESSKSLGNFRTDKYADKVDGEADPDAEIVLETDAPSDCRFFRITRAE